MYQAPQLCLELMAVSLFLSLVKQAPPKNKPLTHCKYSIYCVKIYSMQKFRNRKDLIRGFFFKFKCVLNAGKHSFRSLVWGSIRWGSVQSFATPAKFISKARYTSYTLNHIGVIKIITILNFKCLKQKKKILFKNFFVGKYKILINSTLTVKGSCMCRGGMQCILCLQERFEGSHWKLAQADGEGMWKMLSHFPHKLWIWST